MKRVLCLMILGSALAGAQSNNDDGEKLVFIQEKYLSPEALNHVKSAPVQEASKWLGFGKEIGEAMNGALGAVVGQADKFGATKVGTFTMVMVFGRSPVRSC